MNEAATNGILPDETREHADKRNLDRSFQKMEEARVMAEQRAETNYRALQTATIRAEILEKEVDRVHALLRDLITRLAGRGE